MKRFLNFLDENLLKWGVFLTVLFIPLYPKLPSVHINHVWVYIRLEDFLILALSLIWLVQILRKKIKFYWPLAIPIILYWICGFFSFLNSLYLAPSIPNFFASIAFLSYGRHLEYMILFPIGFSIVKTKEDIKQFFIFLSISTIGIILYGLGQRYYLYLWSAFPKFFETYSFCFPSFQTGNEEFAKGVALCLPSDARITSTFGGHYDLAAFMVMIAPIFGSLAILAKKFYQKIIYFLIFTGSLMLLIFTASRISYVAYLIGFAFTFIFLKKKKWIIPFTIFSIILLLIFSSSTAKRFLETIRFTNIVTNNQGQVVGVTASSLPSNLQNKISKNADVIEANTPSQSLPTGSGFITLPTGGQKTNVAVVQSSLTAAQQKQLKLTNGGVQISTVSGSFLIQKALVYDISFTTRFQGEWPTAWKAFMRNPIIGQGFSTITLATDGEYFRILGESGTLGLISLFLVFSFIGGLFTDKEKYLKNNLNRVLVFGLAGGVIGVLLNGTFIDVLEASKVAETMWLFLGIAAGASMLENKEKVDFKKYLTKIFSSNILIFIYILVIAGIVFMPHVSNFFSADDFTWLKWAASTTSTKDILRYFIDSQGFFYRPIDKTLMYAMYAVLSFQPEGYRVVIYFFNFFCAFGLYLITWKITGKKLISFISSLIFLLNPSHGEDIYWISSISTTLSSVFIIFGLNYWINFRNKNNYLYYLIAFIFFALSLLSYEMSVIFILLVFSYDLIFVKIKSKTQEILNYLPIFLLIPAYLVVRYIAHTVAVGGDYSYNFSHFIPNFIGNAFGYLMLGLFGESTLPFYNNLRLSLKSEILPISLGLIVIFIIITTMIFIFRNRIKLKNNLFIFSILFFVISLLPFLGLGNIAPRYDFLASVGISLFLAFIFINIEKIMTKIGAMKINVFITLLGALLIVIYGELVTLENTQWQKAGTVVENALIYLRTNIPNPASNSNFYFVNNPIRFNNAWVLPLGLSDGMWFIYRDETIKTVNVESLAQGKFFAANNKNSYLLEFDKNYNLKKVKK